MSWTGLNWTEEHPRLLADVTGDGTADIVGFGNEGVWTAVSSRDGTFQTPRLVLTDFGHNTGWRTGKHPRLMADITGDGRTDIVGFGYEGVWTALSNGDGTFQRARFVLAGLAEDDGGWHVGEHLRFLADVTGDGSADIVAFGNDGVYTALSNGDGTFQPPQFVLADFAPNANGWRVDRHPRFLADVTGDGKADIVGFSDDGAWVSLSNGDGTFQPPIYGLADLGYNMGWRVEQHPRFLADITGDGKADIVGFGNDGMWTALSNGAGGFASLQLAIAGFTDWCDDQHPRFMIDITGDGTADLVGFNEQGMWTARSNGNGTFIYPGFAGDFGGSNSGWRVGMHPIYPIDLTGDGRADVVGFGDAGVWVSLGLGNGSFYPPQLVLHEFGAQSGHTELRHIFVLMLENRSFDHMLGFSGITGTDAVTGAATGIDGLSGNESNQYSGQTFPVTRGASYSMRYGPHHDFDDVLAQLTGGEAVYPPGGSYPPINNAGYVLNYAPGGNGDSTDEVMRCFRPEQLPVLNELAREFVVCDRWFSSMPGPTWPNRHFVHAATAGGLDDSPTHVEIAKWELGYGNGFKFTNGTIYDALDKAGLDYRFYTGDSLPYVASLDGVSVVSDRRDLDDMADDLSDDDFAAVSVVHIEPSYDVFDEYRDGSSQHPLADVRRGEEVIRATYEAIRNSPLWEHSMLIITWDEHGGFYDHVAPPAAVAPGDAPSSDATDRHGFVFDQLGPRVPAIVISPLLPKNLIDHRVYDHASIPATIERIFGLVPLTNRDAYTNSLHTLVTLRAARTDTPATLSSAVSFRSTPTPPLSETTSRSPSSPIERDHVAAFLTSVVAQDLEISEPSNRSAIIARAQAIRTHAEALDYAKDVIERVHARREALVRAPQAAAAAAPTGGSSLVPADPSG
jgi:phospholipase C